MHIILLLTLCIYVYKVTKTLAYNLVICQISHGINIPALSSSPDNTYRDGIQWQRCRGRWTSANFPRLEERGHSILPSSADLSRCPCFPSKSSAEWTFGKVCQCSNKRVGLSTVRRILADTPIFQCKVIHNYVNQHCVVMATDKFFSLGNLKVLWVLLLLFFLYGYNWSRQRLWNCTSVWEQEPT